MITSNQPEFGTRIVPAFQELTELKRRVGKNAAYRQWQYNLKHGDKLPRGEFFKGKRAGRPIFIMDEAWSVKTRCGESNGLLRAAKRTLKHAIG